MDSSKIAFAAHLERKFDTGKCSTHFFEKSKHIRLPHVCFNASTPTRPHQRVYANASEPQRVSSNTSPPTRLRQRVPINASTPTRLSHNASPPTRPHQRVYTNASEPQRVSANASATNASAASTRLLWPARM